MRVRQMRLGLFALVVLLDAGSASAQRAWTNQSQTWTAPQTFQGGARIPNGAGPTLNMCVVPVDTFGTIGIRACPVSAPATSTATLATTTTTTLPAATAASGALALDRDGLLHLGKPCDDLLSARGMALRTNQTMCGRNGDFYYPSTACTTGATRPIGLPFASQPGLLLPAGALVYPGWGGWTNLPWVYKTAAACQWGARDPVWCSTAGCIVASGTCTATAQSGATLTGVTDGTCNLVRGGGDCCSSSWLGGVDGAVVAGNGFPGSNVACANGDNSRRCIRAGRGVYGSRDEAQFATGGGAMTGGPDTIAVNNPLHPGFGLLDAPTIAVSTTPPPVMTPLAGTATGALCAAVGWTPLLPGSQGGSTRIGPILCAAQTIGGFRVSEPERDGWTWPVPFWGGPAMGKVYAMWFPSLPCAPYPGQTSCEPTNPDTFFLTFADYLLSPTDYVDFTTPGTPEHESPGDTNDTGPWILATYDATVGFGPCTTGATGLGWPCLAPVDTGYIYAAFSWGNDANCRHGNRGGFPITVSALPTTWHLDRKPFCGADGVAWQRMGPHGASVVHQIIPGVPCTDRWANPDGTWSAGFCNGQLEFYKPGTLTVAFRCNASGCAAP